MDCGTPYSRARRPARTTTPTPFASKGGVMRSRRFFTVVLFSISAWSADLHIKVVDPNSAAVPSAQIELFSGSSSRALALQAASAQGSADFRDVPSGELLVH